MNKSKRKIIRLYVISLLCIACYFFLESSTIISELVEEANKLRHKGFSTFLITGLLKYGLLILGIGNIIIMSFLLIKKQISKNN